MNHLPAIRGIIDRRMLINYRADPAPVARLLPAPFRPKLYDGSAVIGICLIRLRHIRPRAVPRALGLNSENAAHRIAVEWTDAGMPREGVFILRRDTSSLLNTALGGRLFPGVHRRARFEVRESHPDYYLRMRSADAAADVEVDAPAADAWPGESIFPDLTAASQFFESGALGYSPSRTPGRLDGLELRSLTWRVEPLRIRAVSSSLLNDPAHFPPGSIHPDCALLMRNIDHQWHGAPQLPSTPHRANPEAASPTP